MMNEQNLREEIADIFDEMTESDLCYYWNEYCQNNSYYDDMIHYQEEFDDYCQGMTPLEIAELAEGSDITNCKYFRDGSYGLETGDFDDLADIDDLIDYCINSYESLGIPEIDDLLDEFFNQEDEEDEEEDEEDEE